MATPPRWGELFVTATGNLNVFRREHFEHMRDGAIMANSGHFDAELDLVALGEMAEGHVREVRATSRSSTWAAGSSTSLPKAGSSTSPRPRAIRRR